jgi:hypothetical protein
VTAVQRDLEGAGEARLVGPRLALERGDLRTELLAADGVGPARREGDEIVPSGLGPRTISGIDREI